MRWRPHCTIIAPVTNHSLAWRRRDRARMLHPILRTVVKVSAERIEDFARRGIAWAWPNVLLGALVIVPVWFLAYLFRPPGQSRSE
jgi:hypothetical protein